MKLICIALATLAATSSLQAQTSPPPTGTGPTMEQTVTFISDNLQKQGVLHIRKTSEKQTLSQKVHQDQPCTLDFFQTNIDEWFEISMGTTRSTLRYVVDLENSDPHSVRIDHVTSSQPDLYNIFIDRATFRRAALDSPKAVHGAAPLSVRGLIQSSTATSITVISDADNTAVTYTLTKKTDLAMLDDPSDPNKARPISPASIKTGDDVIVEAGSTNHGVTEAKKIKDFGDSEFSGLRTFDTLTFISEEKAERVSKAIVHAITLCHKPDTTSLF